MSFLGRLCLFLCCAGLATLGLALRSSSSIEPDRSTWSWVFLAGLLGMMAVAAWTVDRHHRLRSADNDDAPS